MATEINLDVTRIETIHNELINLDSSLLSNALPELQGTIGNIKNNVQSDNINQILTKIDSQVSSISSALKSDLKRLEEFLTTQVGSYTTSNLTATEKIMKVVIRMEVYATANGITQPDNTGKYGYGATAPSGPSQGTGGNPSQSSPQNQPQAQPQQTPPEQTAPANEKPGFWEYHGQNFANDWDYSGCDAGLDYIVATVDGLCGTVGSVINFVGDGVSEFLGWLFG